MLSLPSGTAISSPTSRYSTSVHCPNGLSETFKYLFSLLNFGDAEMAELKFEIPGLLEEDSKRLEKDVSEFIAVEEKRKRLLLFMDEVMKGAKQLSDEELVKLSREFKKGRAEKLRQMGLM